MKLNYIYGDAGVICFVRGHVDTKEMVKALANAEEDLDDFDEPKHTFFRARPDNTGEYTCWYYEVDGPGRGAFPVTIMCSH